MVNTDSLTLSVIKPLPKTCRAKKVRQLPTVINYILQQDYLHQWGRGFCTYINLHWRCNWAVRKDR